MKNINLFSFDQTAFEVILKAEVEKLVKQHMSVYEMKLAETYYFDDKLLSRKETSEKLNVSIGTVDNLRKSGKLKANALCKGVKFSNRDVLTYMKSLKPC